jgi:hypothetical protein
VLHLKKITRWQRHATPWEWRLFSDSVHMKITSTFLTNQNTYKMTCGSKKIIYKPQSGCTYPCITRYTGYTVCTTWLSLFLHEPNKNFDQSLNDVTKILCIKNHATPWEWRLFSDSVHMKITSTFLTNQNTYKMTCGSKKIIYITLSICNAKYFWDIT